MRLRLLNERLSVCRLFDTGVIDFDTKPCFVGITEDEISFVCPTEKVPERTRSREDGWRGFVIEGVLDFGLVGILSRITSVLAENGIPVFAVSTYNTDYILIKEQYLDTASSALKDKGYEVI